MGGSPTDVLAPHPPWRPNVKVPKEDATPMQLVFDQICAKTPVVEHEAIQIHLGPLVSENELLFQEYKALLEIASDVEEEIEQDILQHNQAEELFRPDRIRLREMIQLLMANVASESSLPWTEKEKAVLRYVQSDSSTTPRSRP